MLHQSGKQLHTFSVQILYISFSLEADTLEILICRQMRKIVPGLQVLATESPQSLLWLSLDPSDPTLQLRTLLIHSPLVLQHLW
jgi:hypothetical protein